MCFHISRSPSASGHTLPHPTHRIYWTIALVRTRNANDCHAHGLIRFPYPLPSPGDGYLFSFCCSRPFFTSCMDGSYVQPYRSSSFFIALFCLYSLSISSLSVIYIARFYILRRIFSPSPCLSTLVDSVFPHSYFSDSRPCIYSKLRILSCSLEATTVSQTLT